MEDFYSITEKTNVENWYPFLKEHTIDSSFLPLSKELALITIKLYKNKYNLDDLSTEESNSFNKLEKSIDTEISKISTSQQVFVRLSTRSPKDSKKAREKGLQYYRIEYETTTDENQKTLTLLKSYLTGLKVSSGKEVLELLCDSERVYDDLQDALENQELLTMKICLREWVDIPFENEFRGFVKSKNLNALTQYYHYIYFKNLPDQRIAIETRVRKFFDQIKDQIPLEDYIIDFVIVKDKILVLELNPFVPGTEAGLFSWQNEKKILEQGPFELRIRTGPVKDE